MSALWSYVLAAIGVTGLYIAATKPRIGWWFNVAAQAVWLAYAIATRQWGFLFTAIAYAAVYARLLRRAYTAGPAEDAITEWGILVVEPHPRRKEKAGDVIKLAGPDAETKSRRCAEIWAGWQPVSRTVQRAGPWKPVARPAEEGGHG